MVLHVAWNAWNSNFSLVYVPFLLVTDTPRNFIAARDGLHTAFTAWSAPASNIPAVEGYEVFYESEYGVRASGGITTAQQLSLELSSLEPNVTYTAFVVAFGGNLPSNPTCSNTATISNSKILHRQPPNVLDLNMVIKPSVK